MEKVTSKLIELLKDCETRILGGENKRIRIIPGDSPNRPTEMMITEFKIGLDKKRIPFYIPERDLPRQKEDYEINFGIIELVY